MRCSQIRVGGKTLSFKTTTILQPQQRQLLHCRSFREFLDVTCGRYHVQISITVEISEPRPPADEAVSNRSEPHRSADVQVPSLPQISIKSKNLVLVIRGPQIRQSVGIEVDKIDSHAPRWTSRIVQCDTLQLSLFIEPSIASIQIKEILDRIVGDVDIQITVQIEVTHYHSQPFSTGNQTRTRSGIIKRAVAVRQKQAIINCTVVLWSADFCSAAMRVVTGVVILKAPIHIVSNVKIQVSVAIDIPPRNTGTPRSVDQSSRFGHRGERPVTLVVEQLQPPVACHQQITKPIVIHVRSPASVCEIPRRLCSCADCIKPTRTVTSQQARWQSFGSRRRRKSSASRKKQVDDAISVVIERRNTSSQCFDNTVDA